MPNRVHHPAFFHSHLNALVCLLISLSVISIIVPISNWANSPGQKIMLCQLSSVYISCIISYTMTLTLRFSLMSQTELRWLKKSLCLSERLVSHYLLSGKLTLMFTQYPSEVGLGLCPRLRLNVDTFPGPVFSRTLDFFCVTEVRTFRVISQPLHIPIAYPNCYRNFPF